MQIPHTYIFSFLFALQKVVTTWWHTSKEGILFAYDNGCIKAWFSQESAPYRSLMFSCNGNIQEIYFILYFNINIIYSIDNIGTPVTKKSSNPIIKLQHIFFSGGDRLLIYSGGCSSLPEGANSRSHILSLYSAQKQKSKPLISFNSRVVDFLCLPHTIGLAIIITLFQLYFFSYTYVVHFSFTYRSIHTSCADRERACTT